MNLKNTLIKMDNCFSVYYCTTINLLMCSSWLHWVKLGFKKTYTNIIIIRVNTNYCLSTGRFWVGAAGDDDDLKNVYLANKIQQQFRTAKKRTAKIGETSNYPQFCLEQLHPHVCTLLPNNTKCHWSSCSQYAQCIFLNLRPSTM